VYRLDLNALTSRRDKPDEFEVGATCEKIRDESGNRKENLEVVRVRFPDGAAATLPDPSCRTWSPSPTIACAR
jgi:hypothetical protein